MALQLGRWDCLSCGQKGNPGNETSCKSCGSPRGKNVEFYLPKDAEDITDEAKIKEANAGEDWLCDYCGSDNKATATSCKSCGNERSKTDKNRDIKEYGLDEIPVEAQKKNKVPLPKPVKPTMSALKKFLIGMSCVFLFLLIIFWPHSFKVKVDNHSWDRSIEIENNRIVTEEDWNVPSGGTQQASFSAIHHYDKIFSHYETRTRTVRIKTGSESYKCGKRSKGNGYFEDKYCNRDVYGSKSESYQQAIYFDKPVYRTKYRYTIYKWLKDHKINDQGNDKNARWPHEDLKDNNWREGKKTEKYVLFLSDKKGNKYDQPVNFNYWSKVDDGQQLDATKSMTGSFYGLKDKAAVP